MSRQTLLDELVTARAELVAALEGLTPDNYLITGVSGIWSVKDILAHLVAWESETITGLNQVQNRRIPSVLRIEDIDEWNAHQYHTNVRRPLQAVLDDFDGTHRMILKMVSEFDSKSLFDNRRYPWMEGEPLAYLISENIVFHEQEHAEQIRAWRQDHGF